MGLGQRMTTGKILLAAVVLGAVAGEALPHLLNKPHSQVHQWIMVLLLPVFLYVAVKTPSGPEEPAPEKLPPQTPPEVKKT